MLFLYLLLLSSIVYRSPCLGVGSPWQVDDPGEDLRTDLVHNVVKRRYLRGARWKLDGALTTVINVYFAIEILDVCKISTTDGQFRLDFNLKQRWHNPATQMPLDLFKPNDSKNSSVTVGGEILYDLWTPDAYMPNSRDAEIEDLTFKQRTVTIYNNKTIEYISNMFTINGCAMDFHWYPMDIQKCQFEIESYSYMMSTVEFHWDEVTVESPVIFQKEFKLRQYTLQSVVRRETNVTRFGRDDKYSRLYIVFVLQRELGHFTIQTFFPTFFIVSLSWFSFWLGLDAIPARVSLLVTCMLTLVTLYTGQKVDLPPVSYVKMMDVWMTTCLGFVFAAMFEFIIVKYISNKDLPSDGVSSTEKPPIQMPPYYNEFYQGKKKPSQETFQEELCLLKCRLERGPPLPAWHMQEDEYCQRPTVKATNQIFDNMYVSRRGNGFGRNFDMDMKPDTTTSTKPDNIKLKLWQKMDRAARVAFPLLFFCFCVIFWPVLMYGDPRQYETRNDHDEVKVDIG